MKLPVFLAASSLASLSLLLTLPAQEAGLDQGNWPSWRGPLQTGVSLERYADWEFDPEPVWTDAISGAGSPVVHGGRIYTWGFRGNPPARFEVLQARDERTGEVIWERETQEFLSDTVYARYAIGSPTVDPETGNIFLGNAYGQVFCFNPDGDILWEHSTVERFGRLTFPNGRAGAPVVDGDIVIVRGVSAYWGADGPARDRFLGFDKQTGDLLWSSTPGVGNPYLKDSSFSTPYLATVDGRRVFYAGTGCGNIVCVNVGDGIPLWRWQISKGGVNASPVIHNGKLINIHGAENFDTTETGRLYAVRLPQDLDNPGGEVEEGQGGAPRLGPEMEAWRHTFEMFTSSPVLHDGRIYQFDKTGTLGCFSADTGEAHWKLKLANSQLHASPAYADGKLYVATNPGELIILDVTADQPVEVHRVKLEGNSIGTPVICNGRLYVHTQEKLYAFQLKNSGITWDPAPETERPVPGEPAKLLPVPSDVLLTAGESLPVRLLVQDAKGNTVGSADAAEWERFIPPAARVRSEMDASFSGNTISAAADATQSAGAWKATSGGLSGVLRGRVVPSPPFTEDFESYELGEERPEGTRFSHPPLSWIGARVKWEIQELEGNKVLAKTLDSVLFMRALSFIGDPELSDYTVQADVMTDGNRRIKSVVGVVNQRYVISLVGNSNVLEVSSNHEHFAVDTPFPIAANQWYTLKARVDVAEDGSGVIRAKAWVKGEPEPEAWTIEAQHEHAHLKGAPGLYGFSPQAQKSVYVDNVVVTKN